MDGPGIGLDVKTLSDADSHRWDNYVYQAHRTTFFHRAGWKQVLERAFGHEAYYLYAETDGRIVGILPLARVKSRLFGDILSSTPFCVYGGPVADSPDIENVLIDNAVQLAEKLNVDALEMRNQERPNRNWPVKHLYATFRKEIDTDNEVNLKAIPNRQRAMVRKAIKEGLESEPDVGVDRLYRVYSESLRNLGTPVFSSRYLNLLQEVFSQDCGILMITLGDRDVAGVFSFYFRDQVLPYYGGSTSQARNLRGVNHFMYWELMRRSADEGLKTFDFGRSKVDTGAYEFKKHFGFSPSPLYYDYHLVKLDAMPAINPTNPKYQYLIQAWKKLPLPVANRIGPFLAKSLG